MFSHGQLRYFVAVAEQGQITRAAKKLHLAQPALSQAIAQLESELGVELFVRHPRGVTLTRAGEAFLVKARAALAAEAETARTAVSLRRAASTAIVIGFVGPPPTLSSAALFARLSERHPEAEMSFKDLAFPCGATAAWLAQVDVAFCHLPVAEPAVCSQAVRVEPRAIMAHGDHRFAGRSDLQVGEVLEETFVGYHPEVQASWAGFHSLDDHRGGPPRQLTGDSALSTLQMVGIMASTRAITVAPYADAKLAGQVLTDLVAIPLYDATPAAVSLVWRRDTDNPLLDELVEDAKSLASSADEL